MTPATNASDARLPRLPPLLDRKLSKTGQTRGADDDVIYQNRVSRASTVLVPYDCWDLCASPQDGSDAYENGSIVLIPPAIYFGTPDIARVLEQKGLHLSSNALVFFETREQWNAHTPDTMGWKPAKRRIRPLGGEYVARVPATTATTDGGKILRGFTQTKRKGAGIRVYEYASSDTIRDCRLQLEALFWLCSDSSTVAENNGMSSEAVAIRRNAILKDCENRNLLDRDRLRDVRILNHAGKTVCPLCLDELSGQGFFARMEQAEGRYVPDITITHLNLFHISELRVGALNHRPYNVGWGHHHCNVVVKDSGIEATLRWMQSVLARNVADGYLPSENRSI